MVRIVVGKIKQILVCQGSGGSNHYAENVRLVAPPNYRGRLHFFACCKELVVSATACFDRVFSTRAPFGQGKFNPVCALWSLRFVMSDTQ